MAAVVFELNAGLIFSSSASCRSPATGSGLVHRHFQPHPAGAQSRAPGIPNYSPEVLFTASDVPGCGAQRRIATSPPHIKKIESLSTCKLKHILVPIETNRIPTRMILECPFLCDWWVGEPYKTNVKILLFWFIKTRPVLFRFILYLSRMISPRVTRRLCQSTCIATPIPASPHSRGATLCLGANCKPG
jgi:hypothetical protein